MTNENKILSLLGCSVTQRAKQVAQPREGYMNPKQMEKITLNSGTDKLSLTENISSGLGGVATDILNARYRM